MHIFNIGVVFLRNGAVLIRQHSSKKKKTGHVKGNMYNVVFPASINTDCDMSTHLKTLR